MFTATVINEKTLQVDGDYVVIDPCHVFDNDNREQWLKMCEDVFFNIPSCGVMEVAGYKIFYSDTKYGDGVYPVGDGEVGVDAGLISIIPVQFFKDNNIQYSAQVINLHGVLSADEGVIYCDGDVVVNTDDRCEEDEDED